MTETEQRIVIAKADGWEIPTDWKNGGMWISLDRAVMRHEGAGFTIPCPNYPRDLNAMHSAIMGQTTEFRTAFRELLFNMANDAGVNVFEFGPEKWAEAFISVLEAKKP